MGTIKEIDIKSIMTRSSLLVRRYSVNPCVGCPHACRCYHASFMKRFTGYTEPWSTFLDVKSWRPITNLRKYDGKRVVIGSVTDGYNLYKEKFHRTRRPLEELRGGGAEIMICTKSDLVLCDLDLLRGFPKVTVSWSVNTFDEQFCADMDSTVSVERRLKAIRQTYEAGIRTVCFVSPIFPRITDVKAIIGEVKDYTDLVWPENLNLRGQFKGGIMTCIREKYPNPIPLYEEVHNKKRLEYWQALEQNILNYTKEQGFPYRINDLPYGRSEEDKPVIVNYFYHEKIRLTKWSYAELMQKSCSADKSTMYVDNIRQSSEYMREMLNMLLDFFRLDNGKEQPNLSPCRISAITHTLETEFMPIAINKGLTLVVEGHTDVVVLTDKERILQIGSNLLSSAIKFTDSGSVSLVTDYNNGLLKLIVGDVGTDTTKDEQQRVFDAFERLSNAAAKNGFGLGLFIMQRIVAMLGGTTYLENEKDKRSRFTVEIPMRTTEELPKQTIQAQMRRNHICHNVIAIDNDEILLLMLKEMYAHEGMHCDACINVSVLMELIRKKKYSLLLTDLDMPEISGFELLELLRLSNVGNSESIPIVVTTASGSYSKEEPIGRGFAGHLFKPFSISELVEITDKCALSSILSEKPDFSTPLSYGNESAMLDKLITETEKGIQVVKGIEQRKDLQRLDALTHHLRSSWQILRANQPLRELCTQLRESATPNDEAICRAVIGCAE